MEKSNVAGYEGYSSHPSSPTKYTVNGGGHLGKTPVYYKVSRGSAITAGIILAIAMISALLLMYFLMRVQCEVPDVAQNDTLSASALNVPVIRSTNDAATRTTTDSTTAFVFSTSTSTTTSKPCISHTRRRLPTDMKPLAYRIRILPFLFEGNFTTSGLAEIDLECMSSTSDITFNIKDMKIDETTIQVFYNNGSEVLEVAGTSEDKHSELYTVVLNNAMPAGLFVTLVLHFEGEIREVPSGFYRTSYIDYSTQQKRWQANTLFSPADARRAYPCFDEPQYKATFTFSIARPTINYTTLSNMELQKSEPVAEFPGWTWDHYHTTPLMSTYLTAFMVTTFNSYNKGKSVASTKPIIDGWAQPSLTANTNFAVELAKSVLAYYEEFFDIPFPLNKIDIVAVPEHNYNAMENWGLIIFREQRLLVFDNSTAAQRQSTALTLAHELAHQWFGNLVTPLWWDELWLKEGFSTYFQYEAIQQIIPDWKVFKTFPQDLMYGAFRSDSLKVSRRLTKFVSYPSKDIFDVVSYNKGASLIRMMSNFLGANNFKMGITDYLQKFAFGNADRDDLWECMTKQAVSSGSLPPSYNVIHIMNTWITQPGFPVITLTRDYDTRSAILTQRRLIAGTDIDRNKTTEIWWVPISWTSQLEQEFTKVTPKIWMPHERSTVIRDAPPSDSWMLLNQGSIGFYRVNYDERNWIMLINGYTSLPAENRAQLISDSMHLAECGVLQYDIALSLLSQLSTELEYLPWSAAMEGLSLLQRALVKMPAFGDLKSFARAIMVRVYDSMLSQNTAEWIVPPAEFGRFHLASVVHLSCQFQESHCVNNARRLYRQWMNSDDTADDPVIEEVRDVVYCAGVGGGQREEWEWALRAWHTRQAGAPDKQALLAALGCSQEQWLLTTALGLIMQPSTGLSRQDGLVIFQSVAKGHLGYRIAFTFVQSQWKRLQKHYGTITLIHEMVASMAKHTNTPNDLNEFKILISEMRNSTGETSLTLDAAEEEAENNVRWMERSYRHVEDWLRRFKHQYNLT